MTVHFTPPSEPPKNPLQMAIEALRAQGKQVAPADIPGLFWVNGQELTINQVIQVSGIR